MRKQELVELLGRLDIAVPKKLSKEYAKEQIKKLLESEGGLDGDIKDSLTETDRAVLDELGFVLEDEGEIETEEKDVPKPRPRKRSQKKRQARKTEPEPEPEPEPKKKRSSSKTVKRGKKEPESTAKKSQRTGQPQRGEIMKTTIDLIERYIGKRARLRADIIDAVTKKYKHANPTTIRTILSNAKTLDRCALHHVLVEDEKKRLSFGRRRPRKN